MGKVSGLLEKDVVKQIRKVLDSYDRSELYYFVKEARSIRGIPDIIICKRGTFIALEVKRSAAELKKPGSKLQAFTINEIRNAGGFAYFIYPENMKEILSIVDSL